MACKGHRVITIHNRQRKIPLNVPWMQRIVKKILSLIEYEDFDIGMLITTNKTIRRYNREYRHKDTPTDILSFRYHPTIKAGKRIEVADEEKDLGDLILSLEYIQKEAQKKGVALQEHLKVLLVHGICHLIGYDHETDADWHTMQAQETFLLKRIA